MGIPREILTVRGSSFCYVDEKPKPPAADPLAQQDGQATDEDHNSWRRSTRTNQQDKSKFLVGDLEWKSINRAVTSCRRRKGESGGFRCDFTTNS